MTAQVVLNLAAVATGLTVAVTLIAAAWQPARKVLDRHGLAVLALVAVGATFGSLYLSEVANLEPCKLCWAQRVFLFPLAIVAPIAAARRDSGMFVYASALATAGLATAVYHVQLQLFPEQSSFCLLDNPCTEVSLTAFGFISIPQLSAIVFAYLLGLSVFGYRSANKGSVEAT